MKHIPNILTMARCVFAMFFIMAMMNLGVAAAVWGLAWFAIASITDFFDGYLARKYNVISNFGKIMDPIADKVLMLSAFILFAVRGLFPWWTVILILIREVGITAIRLWAMPKGIVLAAEKSGKIKTVLQMITVIFVLIFLIMHEMNRFGSLMGFYYCLVAMMGTTVFITVSSGISFLRNNKRSLFHNV